MSFSYSAWSNLSATGDEIVRTERARFERIRGAFAAILEDKKECHDFPRGLRARYLNHELRYSEMDHALTMARANPSKRSTYARWVTALPVAMAHHEDALQRGQAVLSEAPAGVAHVRDVIGREVDRLMIDAEEIARVEAEMAR